MLLSSLFSSSFYWQLLHKWALANANEVWPCKVITGTVSVIRACKLTAIHRLGTTLTEIQLLFSDKWFGARFYLHPFRKTSTEYEYLRKGYHRSFQVSLFLPTNTTYQEHVGKWNPGLFFFFFFGCRDLECFSSLWWYHIDACKLILCTIWKLWLSWSMVVLNCTERFALSFGQHIKCKTLLGLTTQAWELRFCNRITSRNNCIHFTNNMIYDTSYLKKISTLQVWKIILTPIPKEE